MRDWCIYNLSLCNGSDDHNGKGIKGKVVSALRKPDIQYDYILANSRRLSESLFELYSLGVTVPSPPPPLPRWNKSHSMLSFPFIFRYDRYRHHFFISFNWYSKNYQTHNFFFPLQNLGWRSVLIQATSIFAHSSFFTMKHVTKELKSLK